MYIDPYWAGVLSCLFAELAAFFVTAALTAIKKKKEKK